MITRGAYPRAVPAAASTHPAPRWMAANTEDIELGDGTRIRLRPILAEDKQRLTDSMKRMSPESRYLRFLHMIDRLSDAELRYLTEIDYWDHFAWVALSLDEPDEPLIGVARYIRDPTEAALAEAAVAVIDDYQSRGLGIILLTRLAATAKRNGVRSFTAYVSPMNRRILDMVPALEATIIPENGILRIEAPLGVDAAGEANRELLRAAAAGDAEILPPCCAPKGSGCRFNRR
jgi:GNAT superfamily N-acetyltransferase